jgi:uncharacterized membrane protein YoaK (UPF0700 family)
LWKRFVCVAAAGLFLRLSPQGSERPAITRSRDFRAISVQTPQRCESKPHGIGSECADSHLFGADEKTTSQFQSMDQRKPEQMTSQELRIVDTIAQPVARIGSTEQARTSTAHSTTISPAVPALLAFVAGYMDSCTFLAFNGLFVAHVTGSFVVVGSQLVTNNDGFLIKVLAIPAFFAAAVLTTVIVRRFGVGDRRALMTALALEAALLAGLALVGVSASSTTAASIAGLFDLSAMGVQSALGRLLLAQYGSTNVMTTNTTQLAIDLTECLLPPLRDQRDSLGQAAAGSRALARGRLARLAPIVFGFVAGTAAGGLAYTSIGLNCVVLAIGIIAALAVWTAKGQSLRR